MGKKHAPKPQAAPPPARLLSTTQIVALVAALVVLGIVIIGYVGGGSDKAAEAQSAATSTPRPQEPVPPPESALRGPHPQANLPPLPFSPSPPVASMDVVRSVYKFAAEHPEILSYVPCYCGCERSGHRGNEDCFVVARDAKGDVTEWEPHGMT